MSEPRVISNMPLTGVMRTSSSLSPSIFLTMAARGSPLAGDAAAEVDWASAVPPTNDKAMTVVSRRKGLWVMGRSRIGYGFDRAWAAKFAHPGRAGVYQRTRGNAGPSARNALSRGGGACRAALSCAHGPRAYRSAWSTDQSARAASAPRAGPRRG